MHKDKEGKIIATLTEVKNKTGDIFSLVDEFGEVMLTSYNKPKYRITKIDISEILDLREKERQQRKVEAKKPEVKTEHVVVAETVEPKDLMIEKLVVWNVASKNETKFIEKIKKALQ
jgi:hypothetical protein